MLIGFNHILSSAGLNPKRVRLVRHQDSRAAQGRSPYDLWRSRDERFELYQRIQARDYFRDADYISVFVATPLNETLFAGLWRVGEAGRAPTGMKDPARGNDVAGLFLYDLDHCATLSEYSGRIIIDWGKGFRSWVQRADRQDKPIIEIRRVAIEPPFPGFSAFSWSINELGTVPQSWRGALSAVSGVYLLVCRSRGRQYVGSAHGTGGFWQRWEDYLRTGHGQNIGMRRHTERDYQVTILEVASSYSGVDEIVRMEARWKDKLFSRQFGLNEN